MGFIIILFLINDANFDLGKYFNTTTERIKKTENSNIKETTNMEDKNKIGSIHITIFI